MTLTLEIIESSAAMPGVRRHTFRNAGGCIGRGKRNDWVLPHSKVSTDHATITFRNRVFYIQDNSRNGVYLNSESDRITPKVPQLLQSGDYLFIEPYRIQVTIAEDADERALTDADVDPFAPIATPRGASPLVPNMLDSPDVGGAYEGSVNEVDPLKLLGGDAGLGEPGGGGRHGRRRSPEREIRTAEEVERHGDPLIGSYASPVVPPPPPPPKPQLPLQGTRFDPPTGYNPLHDSGVDRGSNAPPPAADRSLPSDPFEFLDTDERVATEPADPNPPPRPWVTPQGTVPVPAARPAPPPPPELSPGAPDEAHAAIQPEVDLQAVLAGAGLANVEVTPALAENFGRILRVVVGGVMEMLRARQEVKDEFRMRQTQFRAADNNPLKFSANVDDALHNLLVKRNAAYLEPVEAFASAFADLRNHELAMLAGLRVAFEAMLAEFDADRLEDEFNRVHKKGALVSVPAKLRYWDAYRDKCQRLLQDVEATYRRWFGEEFVKAYEEQLERLQAERGDPKA